MSHSYKYDVVLSFAGENRPYVEKVAACLKSNDIEYFYDNDNKAELWGKHLIEFFDDLFKNQAKFCVMFISQNYRDKRWTKQERRSALERAFNQDEEYILPVKFDETEIPGIQSTIGHIDLKNTTPEQLCKLILEKLNSGATNEQIVKESVEESVRLPDIPDTDFDEDDEIQKIFKSLESFLDKRNSLLLKKGIKSKKFQESEYNLSYKYKHNGKLCFRLKFWIANDFGKPAINFHHGWNEGDAGKNAMTAWLSVTWKDNTVMILLTNLSLIDSFHDSVIAENEFQEKLWEKIITTSESIINQYSRF